MKIFIKIFLSIMLIFTVSLSGFTQGLEDAQKAIDAEQFQKAKDILLNMTKSHPDEEIGFFYLGWVYMLTDHPDSAKTQFTKGININPKSALCYAGMGAVARVSGDMVEAKDNFDKSLSLVRRDLLPYIYIGRAHLLPVNTGESANGADGAAAVDVLEKAKTEFKKIRNVDLLVTLGDAYLSQLKSTDAYNSYEAALDVEPNSLSANVAKGKLWRMANNWDEARKQFQKALSIDPSFGPAYREWAETDYREARSNINVASQKIKEAVEHYQKYLALTDSSPESQLRYADFLINAGDYQTLQKVALTLSKDTAANLRIYRYLGYAAYENKEYEKGLSALQKFMTQADAKRIIPRDYLYLGRLQVKNNSDSIGISNMEKAARLDSTFLDVYSEIAGLHYSKKQYEAAGDAYRKFIDAKGKASLNDYFREGMSYYFAYSGQYFKSVNNKEIVPDTTLLALADSAFSYVAQKTASKPVADVFLYRARVNDLKDADRSNMQSLAKPFYEQYILLKASADKMDERTKKNLGEAYSYLGSYYQFQQKNELLAKENYEKARTFDPESKQANIFFSNENSQAANK